MSAYRLSPEEEESLAQELRDLLMRNFVMKHHLSNTELKMLLDRIPELQEFPMLLRALSQPCEKAVNGECRYASPNCYKAPPYDPKYWRTIPARRWMDCYGWKKTIGFVFSKKLGCYIPEKCPVCGVRLV
jgi:hypothetical protein